MANGARDWRRKVKVLTLLPRWETIFRTYASCLTLGCPPPAASTATLAREYVDERGAPAYVEPGPHDRPVVVAGTHTVTGWHGDRYWDGHRWWQRDEWNRHHHHNDRRHYDHDHDQDRHG